MKKIVRTAWKRFVIAILAAGLSAHSLCGDDQTKELYKSYREDAKRYGFSLKGKPQFSQAVKGIALSAEQAEPELVRFFKALDNLGEDFVKKSGLQRVMICKNLTLYGNPCGGVASGPIIYLNKGFDPRTVYHEMYHIFDRVSRDTGWQKCNHDKFLYRGIDFEDKPLSERKKKKLKKNDEKYDLDFSGDFVSRYAMSNEHEDRAETFAYMIDQPRLVWARAKKSRALRKKMQYIIKATSRKSLLGEDYWVKKYGPSVLQKNFPMQAPESAVQRKTKLNRNMIPAERVIIRYERNDNTNKVKRRK